VASRAPRPGLLVEDDQILAAHTHRRDPILPTVRPQPDAVLVEAHRAVEAGDRKVHGPQAERVGQPRRRAGGAVGEFSGSFMSFLPSCS
jgi:hypothetical protein